MKGPLSRGAQQEVPMADGLVEKRVLITAGGAGIGRAIAGAFGAAGARVHVCDVDAEALA